MDKVTERLIRYAAINTMSDETSDKCPSSEGQWDLARVIEKEMIEMGLADVHLDENCYLTATLESNTPSKSPVIGLIAHFDTSPDMTAKNVKPKKITGYDGKDIILNKKEEIVLSPEQFPELLKYVGDDIITTDGTTLLGADDKAGIAEIMTAMDYFLENPDIKHGRVRIGFTPDEEIGRGADRFDVKGFGADFAYTVDGGEVGELEFENFNAALATVIVRGRNVHPGTAKNQMINGLIVINRFVNMLPPEMRPEHTTGYEGFFHLIDIKGRVEEATARFLVRDHDRKLFEEKKENLRSIAAFLNEIYGENRIELTVKDQYYNMREKVEPHYHIIELAAKAMSLAGVQPLIKPIRGGTDGARLSFMGLPTPNIFTGGHNFHGRYEYIPVSSMTKAVETIKNIVRNGAES